MNWRWIREQCLPPLLNRILTRRERRKAEIGRGINLYGQFLKAGDLCYDVGANLGNRVRCFRAMDVRVLAVEPQSRCLRALRKEFGGDRGIEITPVALGAAPGKATLKTSAMHVLSTLSPAFTERTKASGRFEGVEWSSEEEVEVTTLDQLIAIHGLPRFVKIDVEGFENQVLAGLSRPVPALSFEWTPEIPENSVACIERLGEIGEYEYNYSWGESMRLARPQWLEPEAMLRIVGEFAGESQNFGDIYARLRQPS